MLDIGSIVAYSDHLWRVLRRNHGTRTAILEQWDGTTEELADDADEQQADEVSVWCNPSKDWPFVPAPSKTKAGPIEAVTLARPGDRRVLRPMVDWVPSDRRGRGGSLFFHPSLNLRQGEVLSARHKNGSMSRVSITRSFGTLQRRMAVEMAKRRPHLPPNTIYSRLMGEDQYED